MQLLLWIITFAVIVTAVGIRLRMLDVPLDRDEGGYAYAGQMILQGVPPFKSVSDLHMPGLYGVYSIILSSIGRTPASIHFALMLVNIATIVLIFLLGKRLIDTTTGLTACAAFAIMSISQTVEGFSANTEPFVLFPAVCGLLLLLRAESREQNFLYFAGGFVLGLTVILKQHGIFQVGVGICYIPISYLGQTPKTKSIHRFLVQYLLFILGISLPFLITCYYFWSVGIFAEFWYWIFEHSIAYSTTIPIAQGIKQFIEKISNFCIAASVFWVFATIGAASLCLDKKVGRNGLFVLLFFFFSFLSTIPGFKFFPHYWTLLLPSLALLSSIGINWVGSFFVNHPAVKNGLVCILLISGVAYTLIYEKDYFFNRSPDDISWSSFGFSEAFPISPVIADVIKQHSAQGDRLAILGSEPQITYLSGLQSVTSYIWVYGLMLSGERMQEMQKQMISDIETAKPRFIVYVSNPNSWSRKEDSPSDIFVWTKNYLPTYYTTIGIVDIFSDRKQIFVWGEKALHYIPQSKIWIGILEKKR